MPRRSWEEITDETTGEAIRWDLFEEGSRIEGAYVAKVADDSFELHFPRLVTSCVSTLSLAKETLENAPLTKHGGIVVGREATETDIAAFVTSEEAGEMLGISRPRVNAMVANGVLAGKRINGKIMVSRAAIERKLNGEQTGGPQGKFANQFVQYFPDRTLNEFYLAEVDAQDSAQTESAQEFIDAIAKAEQHPGAARLLDYRAAMRLRHSKHRVEGSAGIPSFPQFFEAIAKLEEEHEVTAETA